MTQLSKETLMTPVAVMATTAPSAASLTTRANQALGLAGGWWWGEGAGCRGPRRRIAMGVRACCPDQVVVGRLHVSSSPRTLPPCPDLYVLQHCLHSTELLMLITLTTQNNFAF